MDIWLPNDEKSVILKYEQTFECFAQWDKYVGVGVSASQSICVLGRVAIA